MSSTRNSRVHAGAARMPANCSGSGIPCGRELRSATAGAGSATGTTIMCQCHGSEFDITTGAVVSGPAPQPLNVYDVQVVDGSIRIRV